MIPIGFHFNDCIMSPFIKLITDRVDPQEGQGSVVVFFNMQKPISEEFTTVRWFKLYQIQA